MEPIIVKTTCANLLEAEKVARKVLEKRLAACVQISAAQSLYWWNGAIEQEQEYLVAMKSSKSLFNQLSETIKKHHSYDVPEIIAENIVAIEHSYDQWMKAELAELS